MHTLPWHVPVPHNAARFDQLDVLEPLVPHHLQIVDGDLRARADDAGRGARWQVELCRGRAHGSHVRICNHACEQVARCCMLRGDHHRLARGGRAIDRDDRAHPVEGALEAAQLLEIDGGDDAEVDAGGYEPLCGAGRIDAPQHVAFADGMQLRRACRDDDVVCMYVKHVAVGETGDHNRTRIDADHIVTELAGEHRNSTALGSGRRGCRAAGCTGADHHEIGVVALQPRRGVIGWRNRVDRWLELQRRRTDGRMTLHAHAGPGRCEAGTCEGDSVDLRTAVPAVACQAQRAAVLGMLPVTDDGNGNGVSVGVVDRTVVNHDAHARSTVANRGFAARLCGESLAGSACETTPMDPLTFHREALDVAQRIVDDVDRSHFELPTPCDQWNVRQVLEHMIGGNRRIAGDPPAEGEDLIGDDPSTAYAAAAATAAATFGAPGGLERTFKLSFGEVPGSVAVRARATDQLAHAWDLAKATGRSTDLSPEMYTTALELLQQRFATRGRNPATYAEEQQPPVGACAADRFAAFAGRRP